MGTLDSVSVFIGERHRNLTDAIDASVDLGNHATNIQFANPNEIKPFLSTDITLSQCVCELLWIGNVIVRVSSNWSRKHSALAVWILAVRTTGHEP